MNNKTSKLYRTCLSVVFMIYTQLAGFVVRGPRASQCLTLSEDVESS